MNRILVIDDEVNTLEAISLGLRRRGYEVIGAKSGEEGLDIAKKERFDVVLIDLVLPGISGLDVLQRIRTIDSELEVIIMTGHSSISTAIESMKEGAYDYIEKPLSIERLTALIEKVLEKHQLTETVALYEISKVIFSTIELENLLKIIIDQALKLMRADEASIMLFDEANRLYIAGSFGLNEEIRNTTRLAIGERIAGWVAENRQPLILINGLKNDARFSGISGREDIKSAIVTPLLKNEKALGILSVNRITNDINFTKTDLYKITIFASLVSLALDNARLYRGLLEAHEKWKVTFDSIPDMVSIHDKDFKILNVNRSFADALKRPMEEITGKRCYELVHAAEEPPQACPHRVCLQGKKAAKSEFSEPNLGLFLEVSTSPIFSKSGEVLGSIHIARDITVRKQIEKNQRLAELGKLVADMAHEVNNPLMIISGNAQLCLMQDLKNDEVSKSIKIVFEEAKRAKDIIQRLLKFSRPSKEERKETDINSCIDAMLKIIEHQFSLANVELRRDYSRSLPRILADEKQLQEVFINLLNNSREAMTEGGQIFIRTIKEDGFLRIDFKDNGPGMDREVRNKIFEPFFTTKEKGTGLGLPLCYGIIKAHGGWLEFESLPGKGTTAIVRLPIKVKEPNEQDFSGR